MEKTTDLTLRQANLEDAEFILEIANEPQVRIMSFNQNLITFDEHIIWFKKQIETQTPFYIGLHKEKLCGYVRFDISKEIPIVSIALHKNFKNKGLGKELLALACRHFFLSKKFDTIHAYIKQENYSSFKAFQYAGFYEISTLNNTCILMELKEKIYE